MDDPTTYGVGNNLVFQSLYWKWNENWAFRASHHFEARDGRRHLIQITDAGRQATRDAVPQMIEPLHRAFSDLTPDEFATLDRLLRKVTLSFDKGAISHQEAG